ncbi:acyl-CoA dehydrogenase family protein [Schauerella aestuarii]|uniref:acyl-CoA dehydrogenase family protein n=1 Tax=Schauerella aestuarii TaxID=2511204 RepID=UPI0013699548|nr:acyl-CoA dehydrogenase family protein [Achromobacter aestuarii]
MPTETFSTHDVTNQVAPLADVNLWTQDVLLRTHACRYMGGAAQTGRASQAGRSVSDGDSAATDDAGVSADAAHGVPARDAALDEHGAWVGSAATLALGDTANRYPPEWVGYDATGHRIDAVRFHPAWHALMYGIAERGLHSAAWLDGQPGAHVARAAAFILQGQAEAGTLCPTTMTFAAVPILAQAAAEGDAHAAAWARAAGTRVYDPVAGAATAKRGALFGMGLTEKQGGSDLRAVTTRAVALAGPGTGQSYHLTGHKWFFSVPQADAHLVLARAGDALSCFLVPGVCPDGRRNAVRIRRLKDKIGNRSNASAEVEFENAWGTLLGEPGRGLAVLLRMAAVTRLDCVLGSTALLRRAVSLTIHHAQARHAFGRALIDQPLMTNVLADAALEAEAAIVLGLRLARLLDQGASPAERLLFRVGTPAAKLWVCKRTIAYVAECLEACGGNGYIEDGPMARLYREAPVNSIWEGSGNVMALDVLRAFAREGGAVDALEAEWQAAFGVYPAFDRAMGACLQAASRLSGAADAPHALTASNVGNADVAAFPARRLAADVARLWQAALLIRHAPAAVADAFVASRLADPAGASRLPGELSPKADASRIVARARLQVC